MALPDPNLPPDPFSGAGNTDLTAFAANCYAMYTAFIGAGFTELQALRFTIDLMASMFTASARK